MAMSRFLSPSLPRRPPTAIINHHRNRSNKTHHVHLIELDLDPSSSSHPDLPEAAAELVALDVRRLEDAIQRILVRRAAPDWLPFLPGYSYWVPPRAASVRSHPAGSMIEVIGKISSSGALKNVRGSTKESLPEDEQMAYASAKGWPSSSYFIEGTSPMHPIPAVKVEVKVHGSGDNLDETFSSEDEEG